ncbi:MULTISPECIES: haloacid dehalogenase type II [Methylobacterium]|uniref:(S)-2-haloacid dehalogenase n=1 Tax=Methylobacterium brachiatum TaxID=269660 RepID=A0AAJ1TNH6_9HYPH|nr:MULTISPECIES: haloacid dehalogenase type II [Methylobacterium]EIZ82431.1 haloacid dehalogenase [Methylobacterium sp. GXF4]KNY24122.1 haloacid dehalogenase [Methylobacterium sp. ARG-1]MCB4803351.1 haloacid dehalogenase type II [Methylobacterium brachiatum]MDH2312619.1 haloacid dehalogenase type II [Methylobacterium brachiatum]MDQ0544081.1 2-haloacid dehalogenase [Methylobacterium brachiatum]
MTDAKDLLAGVRAVVFDAYGTLFDVNAAVQRYADAVGPDADHLSEVWRNKQLEYSWTLSLMGRYAAFWDLTVRALDYALAVHPGVDPALRERLLDAYRDLDAYPEVPEVLASLRKRGLRTAVLTNGNAAMVDRAVASAGLADHLDAVLSVDDAQVFKTHPDAYRIALLRLAVGEADVLFCSSNRWDVAGAHAFGFRTAWVNRRGLPDEYADLAPTSVIGSLDGLL